MANLWLTKWGICGEFMVSKMGGPWTQVVWQKIASVTESRLFHRIDHEDQIS